jgi:hypothetical protein
VITQIGIIDDIFECLVVFINEKVLTGEYKCKLLLRYPKAYYQFYRANSNGKLPIRAGVINIFHGVHIIQTDGEMQSSRALV